MVRMMKESHIRLEDLSVMMVREIQLKQRLSFFFG